LSTTISPVIWQIVLSVVILLSSGLLAVCFGVLAYMLWKMHKLFSGVNMADAAQSIVLLKDLIDKLQAGTIKICETQVEAITSLEATVSRFRDLMFAGDNKGFQEYDEAAASREYEIQELVNSHRIPRPEAEARVRQNDLYSKMSVRS
jgi:hypothetical protein